MGPVLDIVALRSLLAVADCGGFHRAAEVLRVSQPAVSQHVRRLEKAIGRPLVERQGRRTVFTPDGQALIADARCILAAHDNAVRRLIGAGSTTITIGTTEHAADLILPVVTAVLAASHPGHEVRFRIDRTVRLDEGIDRGALDLAVSMAEVSGARAEPVGSLPLTWYAAPGWRQPADGDPWPVVAIEEPCLLRRRAIEALAARELRPYVVCDTGYVAGVMNAVRAGIGVALLADAGSPPDGLTVRHDLPAVAPAALGLRARQGADPVLAATVTEALRAALGHAVEAVAA
ncbi:LysR family transcriptional regulator [Actinoplanes friuliensis]|jgi:DNA-binding transcriptional LysR family regulator|uniref:LysR family transcriptional regulator n=1 Tax=Actinoplanes friuliensis DSM 7358 TaxID=1246995 RepID=U5W127_9ACTN|nr:LysR family transcriptional regulator [Actinoplanes friuliensis]AGZ42717.1 LysR family transcriptional regulator [Actinoplanes friuliensis DSM 7358]